MRYALLALAITCLLANSSFADETAIDFQRDVRPILSSRCFACHGPDDDHREADLRFDTAEGGTADLGGYAAIVPGDPEASELLTRVTTDDPDLQMPPADSGERLTTEEVETLRKWIAEGATWGAHWAFEAPTGPEIPEPVDAQAQEWIAGPIDAFVLARLQEEELAPEPRADRLTLLRRLSLDLVGLPPKLEEIDAFLADNSADAYEKLVERLLESPHYGERWGRLWLDAARYADSDGFEKDKPRSVWMYRDWVVDALNRDQPYNEFLIDQIAGDLRENPTQDQVVATGFLRNSMLNEEGGIDPEQFRMEAMFDRMDAVGKAILGLTIQCGQCHSHKYDPLTQDEYYRMFAFLNNSHEGSVTVYTNDEQRVRSDVLDRIAAIETELKSQTPDWRERVADWAQAVIERQPEWSVLPAEYVGDNGQRYFFYDDHSIRAAGYAPTKLEALFTVETDLPEIRAFRLEALIDPNLPAGGPGRATNGLFALTEFKVEAQSIADPSQKQTVTFTRALADYANAPLTLQKPFADKQGNAGDTGPAEFAIDGKDETAWGIDAGPGRRNQSRQAVFIADKNVVYEGGTKLSFRLVQKHGGWNSDDNQTMNLGRFRVSATSNAEFPDTIASPRTLEVLDSVADTPAADWSEANWAQLFSAYRQTVADLSAANAEIERIWSEHPEGATQLVLTERTDPRITHRLNRGNFLAPEDQVDPGVPAFLHPLNVENPTRLDFARWLADPRSPTTARAIINRVWQAYFGRGFSETAEDLGLQGETPSHPQLLDWLAVDFMEHGWSLKRLHRQIVMSSTYQQSSHVSPEKLERDPYNRLLARGPRYRVDAEVVRDIALTASGLLNHDVGGPPVYPPAPEFLFVPPASYGPKTWDTETDDQKYRRAMYTFRFRSVPYPALQAFDAPNADIACVRRSRSNTPLQALTTLNEPLFLECAQALARKTVREGGPSFDEMLTFAFRRCLTRAPTPGERDLLSGVFGQAQQQLADNSEEARQLAGLTDNEAANLPDGTSTTDLAAWTALSRVLLNLDETITKE